MPRSTYFRVQHVPARGRLPEVELCRGRPTSGPCPLPAAVDLSQVELCRGRPTSGSSTLPSAADLSEVELCRGRPTRPTACTMLAATRVRIGNAPIITHVRTSHWIPTGAMDVYIHWCMHNTHVLYMYPCKLHHILPLPSSIARRCQNGKLRGSSRIATRRPRNTTTVDATQE